MASRCTAHALADAGGERRFGRRRYAKVGGHLYGRFCVGQVGAVAGGKCRAGGPLDIRRGFAGIRQGGQLRAKVGGHPYGRFCGRWPGSDAGRRSRCVVGNCGPMSPQTWWPYSNPSLSQIGCRRFPADARGLLNAPQRPSQPPQRDDL